MDKRFEFLSEPNEVILESEHGIEAVIVRSTWYGSLSGFVGVPEGHPAYENEGEWGDIDVHGGWSSRATDNFLTRKREDLLWMRFDCSHIDDYKPYRDDEAGDPENYRNIDYVKNEIHRVRNHLFEMMNAPAP